MVEFLQIGTWRWGDYRELKSTNDEALLLGSTLSENNKIVITAQKQVKGRGRRGRSWIGQEGNLFMSLLLYWPLVESAALVFIVSFALLQTVKRFASQANVCLKWPNDVLLNGRKLSGILLEAVSSEIMVIGIGVNIKSSPADNDALYAITSLYEAGIECDRLDFMKRFLAEFDEVCAIYETFGMSKIAELWQAHAKGLGDPIVVRMPKSEEKGIFKGIGSDGMLLLQMPAGNIKTISVGDVFFDEDGKKEEQK